MTLVHRGKELALAAVTHWDLTAQVAYGLAPIRRKDSRHRRESPWHSIIWISLLRGVPGQECEVRSSFPVHGHDSRCARKIGTLPTCEWVTLKPLLQGAVLGFLSVCHSVKKVGDTGIRAAVQVRERSIMRAQDILSLRF